MMVIISHQRVNNTPGICLPMCVHSVWWLRSFYILLYSHLLLHSQSASFLTLYFYQARISTFTIIGGLECPAVAYVQMKHRSRNYKALFFFSTSLLFTKAYYFQKLEGYIFRFGKNDKWISNPLFAAFFMPYCLYGVYGFVLFLPSMGVSTLT